jgi:hypothetical protein
MDDVLNFLCASAGLREIFYLWRPVLPDPKDDFVLELAVESRCEYIVTFNMRISSERRSSASPPLGRRSFCGS